MSKRIRSASPATETGAERRRRRGLEPHQQAPEQAIVAVNRVRCECSSIARGEPNNNLRCNEALDPDEFRHGRTLCPRCRPPDCLAISRGRRIANHITEIIQELGVQFDPPLNFEMSRRRQIGMIPPPHSAAAVPVPL